MTNRCKHCATPYTDSQGVDGFCCPGCQQVYLLIQQEGLGDYYRLQDRVAEPLKDRAQTDLDAAAFHRTQTELEGEAESARAVFAIEGMSCMGCAWLIERLCANQVGLDNAEASLSSYSLRLEWRSAEFDLAALGAELMRFGYRLASQPRCDDEGARISPLALRLLLTAVFAGNALLLAAYQQFVATREDGGGMVGLLSLVCLCFTLMLGAAPFIMSVYRAAQIRRWHSDCFVVVLIIAFGGFAFSYGLSVGAFLLSWFILVLICARWLEHAAFR